MRRLALVALLLCTSADLASAVPRYTARYRQNCTLCHQNPTGGGMRSLYASQFLVPTELAWKTFTPEKVERIHPDVSPSLTLGTDFRTIHVYASDATRPESNFFQMQGDLYAAFAVDDRFSANLDVDQVGSVEAYGLGWILPWSGYFKVGRFTPAFGWKYADHNRFTREELGFDQPSNTDAGIEVGVNPRHVSVWAAIHNGEPGTNTLWDTNREVACSGGALGHFTLAKVGFGLGGSIWYNGQEPASGTTGRRTAGGPYGYVNWRQFSWLWEVDASRLTIPHTISKTLLVTSHEVTWEARRGFDVVATYDYVDRDLDLKTGTRSRYGLGLEIMPVPSVQVQATLNRFETEQGLDVTSPDFTRSEVQLHLFY